MKIKILLFLSLFAFLSAQAQWHQYAKPNVVNQMVKDASGNYHYATDIGYVKFDNLFNVVDYKNLVTQSTPIGNVTSLSINPLNDQEIAICEPDRVTIWTNGVLTQTIEIVTAITNYSPQICFNNNNEIYVFDKSQNDYKIISNGVLSDVVTPGVRPQAIVENNAGTKVYFAGWNNGLWEYTKATDTWVNYNESNSNLIYDPLESLFIAENDDLYIGGFQGLNVLSPSGTMTACQQNAGPGNPFFFAAYEIDVNSNGDVLVRSSEPNGGSNFGFCVVDMDTCSWTNFSDGGTNCLDSNSFRTVQFSSSGNEVIATKTGFDTTDTFTYNINAPMPTCSELDFNYLGAADMYRSFGFSEVSIRESNTSGNFDIAITNENGVDIVSLPEENFNGNFPASTNFNPFSDFSYDIISFGDYFVFTDGSNTFTFLKNDGTSSSHTLSIPDFSINKTKRANVDVSGSTCTLVFSGWEGPSFETKVYITECDMVTGACTAPIELFSANRDKSEPITFTCTEDADSDNFRCAAIKQALNISLTSSIAVTEEIVSAENGTETILLTYGVDNILSFILTDPIFVKDGDGTSPNIFIKDQFGTTLAKINRASGFATIYDLDGARVNVELREAPLSPGDFFEKILSFLSGTNRPLLKQGVVENSTNNGRSQLTPLSYTDIPGSVFNDMPADIFIYSVMAYPYSSTEYATVLMTNYGLLIKSEIDYSFFVLDTVEYQLAENVDLYPNPSSDFVSFSDNSITEIQVFDMRGKMVKQSKSNTISVKTLSSGLYIVKGTDFNGNQIVKKLVKN